ncbi:insecticidal delta-endotoxin Cry8Ea1 family protein [Kitasatospora sp. NPDC002551]|uniref:insecticidal delta-endotoxin Cry8Ea1 family protein n=1 Tax=Kitasatospora sp. NPDC002551 TaxID=3154539 RepID=UPI003325C59A
MSQERGTGERAGADTTAGALGQWAREGKDISQTAIDAVKVALPALLKLVPGIGTVAGAAMGLILQHLFPGPDVWSQLREKVEKLIGEKLNQAYYEQLQADLNGLRTAAEDYSDLARLGEDLPAIRAKWIATETVIAAAAPRFNPTGTQLNPVLVLPLFIQVVNLHLVLLRDMTLHGRAWGFEPSTVDTFSGKLTKIVGTQDPDSYPNRAKRTYDKGFNAYSADEDRLRYEREMVFNGWAQHSSWPYFDALQYPEGHDVDLDWVVYDGPLGRIMEDMPAAVRARPLPYTQVRDLTVYRSSVKDGSRVAGARWQPWNGKPVGPVVSVGKTDTGAPSPIETGARPVTHVWGIEWDGAEHGVLKLAFGVGGENDTTKAPPGWVGNTGTLSRDGIDFYRTDYVLSDIQGGKFNDWGRPVIAGIEWMAFGFRPLPTHHRPSEKPAAGGQYLLQSVHDGRYLVPKSLAQGSQIGLTRDFDATGALWSPDDAGRLRNTTSGAYLRVKPPAVAVTLDVPGTSFAWTRQDDGTYVVSRGAQGFLTTNVDTLVDAAVFDPEDLRMRWVFVKVAPRRRHDGTRPSLALRTRRRDVGYFEAAVTVSNPSRGRTIPANWRLSLVLPPQLGGPVNATGHPITPEVVSAKPHDRGLLVELSAAPWSARKAIEPGETFTFTLTGGAATATTDIRDVHIWADVPRIDGLPIENTTHPEHGTHPNP